MELKPKHFISISLLIFYQSMVYATRLKPPSQTEPSKHFVLIHGSGHGAWSWYKIIEPLRSSGYTVTAIDLAASGINPNQVKFVESISDYHQPLMDFMASLPQHKKVILVGHSLGGLALTQAMESFPEKVCVAVFVTALMPGPQLNFTTVNQQFSRTTASTLDSTFIYDNGPNNLPTARLWGPLYLRLRMYSLSPIQDWVLATTLMRPRRLFGEEEQSKKIVATKDKYGSVKRVFVVAEKDQVSVKKDFQLWMIQNNPPNEVVEIFGSDHMVMMSKPKELCNHLFNIATKYN